MTITFIDENDDEVTLEFLGLILLDDHRFGFFVFADEDESDSTDEVIVLEVVELDEDGQPTSFELVSDEDLASKAYREFQKATHDLYEFE